MQNAIKGPEIAKALNKKGFRTTAESIHSIIGKIIEERNYPICSVCGKGYYYPKNDSDIQAAIDDINKKRDGLQKRIDFLKNLIIE